MNFSISYPLRRHNFQRLGFTYSFNDSNITAFSTASQTFFQTIAFRSGIQGSNALTGIVNSSASFSYVYNTVNNPLRPRTGKEYTAVFQFSGIGGNLRYFAPFVAYKSYRSMHYFRPDPTGHNVLALRAQLGYIQGFGGDVAPPNSRFYAGGEQEIRGFDIRGATPYGYVPNRTTVQLTNPDGSLRASRPNQPTVEPVHPGAHPRVWHRFHRRRHQPHRQRGVPHSHRRPGHLVVLRRLRHRHGAQQGTARAEPRGIRHPHRSALRLRGLQQRRLPGRHSRDRRSDSRETSARWRAPTTCPACRWAASSPSSCPSSTRPSACIYAYNPLRLYETPYCNENANGSRNQSCSAQLITRDMFPPGGAGDYTYQEAIQGYGALNQFREPRKTFRLAVSTTF